MSRMWSRTVPETQIPPGSASASRRAATLTPSPKMSSPSAITSPRLTPTRNLIFCPSGLSVDDALVERSQEHEVFAVRMRVMRPEDILVTKLAAMTEQRGDRRPPPSPLAADALLVARRPAVSALAAVLQAFTALQSQAGVLTGPVHKSDVARQALEIRDLGPVEL